MCFIDARTPVRNDTLAGNLRRRIRGTKEPQTFPSASTDMDTNPRLVSTIEILAILLGCSEKQVAGKRKEALNIMASSADGEGGELEKMLARWLS